MTLEGPEIIQGYRPIIIPFYPCNLRRLKLVRRPGPNGRVKGIQDKHHHVTFPCFFLPQLQDFFNDTRCSPLISPEALADVVGIHRVYWHSEGKGFAMS